MTPTQKLTNIVNDVTRFLVNPGCRVAHHNFEFDLQVTSAKVVDGVLICQCTDTQDGGSWAFPFSELFPAGPVNDALRETIRLLIRATVEDGIARMQAAGKLTPLDLNEVDRELMRAARPDDGEDCLSCATTGHCSICGGRGWLKKMTAEDMTIEPFDIALADSDVADAPPGVHHLQVHPEYVIEPGSTHARPVRKVYDPRPPRDKPDEPAPDGC